MIQAILLGAEIGGEGRLVWTAPEWVLIAVCGGALAAWVLSLRGARSVAARIGEAAGLMVGLSAMIVIAARPVWLEEAGRSEPGRTVVLVDGSRSMRVLDRGESRAKAATAIATKLLLEGAEVFTFGDEITAGLPTEFTLGATDIGSALAAVEQRFAGERLEALVLVTDGIDRGGLRGAWVDGERPAPPRVNGPLTVFQVGSADTVRDLSVRRADAGGFTFIKSKFTVTGHIEGSGFEGRSVNVQLLQDGLPIQERPVRLDAAGSGQVAFEVEAWNEGRFNYEVRVPLLEGDAVPENNSAPVVVRVVRDRLRVLQVAGTPTWDVKFLRRFLKDDPSVDLVSFFILRTQEDLDAPYSPEELSLIAFPHEDLFTNELQNFDVVVFQNFDYAPYFRGQANKLLGNVRRYVEEQGGALVMVGGDRSFDLGQYGRTPLHNILPVKLGLPEGQAVTLPRFRPALTPEGARHPITQIGIDADDASAIWSRLAMADGANRVLGLQPGAVALLTHPSELTPTGDPQPVLAVREVGKGRTMALTIDASWRWSFSEAGAGHGNQAYLRFWKNAFRWLMSDPATSRVTVDTARENYALGDVVRIVVRARDPGFGPLVAAPVEVTLVGDGGSEPMVGVTDREGELVLEWPAARRGAFRVRARVKQGAEAVGESDTVFAVTSRDPELADIRPDAGFLKALAESVGGRYFAPGEAGAVLRDPLAARQVSDRSETPLWRAPGLGLLALLGLGFAWIIRRRAGLR